MPPDFWLGGLGQRGLWRKVEPSIGQVAGKVPTWHLGTSAQLIWAFEPAAAL